MSKKHYEGLVLPGDPEYTRTAHGAMIVDGREVASTIQCVHCGDHWVPVRGSGIKRGFCRNCMGPCCGAESCMACDPFEKKLDRRERAARISPWV